MHSRMRPHFGIFETDNRRELGTTNIGKHFKDAVLDDPARTTARTTATVMAERKRHGSDKREICRYDVYVLYVALHKTYYIYNVSSPPAHRHLTCMRSPKTGRDHLIGFGRDDVLVFSLHNFQSPNRHHHLHLFLNERSLFEFERQ